MWGPIDSDTGAVVVYDLSLGIPVDVLEAPSGQGNTGYGSTLAGWGIELRLEPTRNRCRRVDGSGLPL